MRCVIVDDNASFLKASRSLLEREGVSVAGTALTAADGVRLADELAPDVILVDIDLGADSGLVVARQLAAPTREVRHNVILVSAHPEDDFAELVAQSPALGFIAKTNLSAAAIRRLLTGPSAFPGT